MEIIKGQVCYEALSQEFMVGRRMSTVLDWIILNQEQCLLV